MAGAGGQEEPPFEGYTCRVHVGAGRAGMGIDVYVREDIALRAALLWERGDGNTLLMEFLTQWRTHPVLIVHSPQSQVGQEVYLPWWAEMWRHVAQVVEPVSVLQTRTRQCNRRIEVGPGETMSANAPSSGLSTSETSSTSTPSPRAAALASRGRLAA